MADKLPTARQGSTLLYAILVLAAVVAVSITLSNAILSSLRQANNLDMAIKAYYMADMAAEDALYRTRILKQAPATLASASSIPTESWVRSVTAASTQITTQVPSNKTFQLDLYNPGNTFQKLQAPYSTIRSLSLSWGPITGTQWLEVSSIGWNIDGTVDPSVSTQVFAPSAQPATISLATDDLYKVRIKALYDTVYSLNIVAKDAGGATVPIPGKLVVKSTGVIGNTNQAIEVTVKDPAYPSPISGLYDYVIFSEDSLIK